MNAENERDAHHQLKMLRDDMERELKLRHRANWGATLAVLTLSIVVAAIGAAGGIDLLGALGEWRTGVVVLTGSALLFSFAILLQQLVQSRSERDLKYGRELLGDGTKGTDSSRAGSSSS